MTRLIARLLALASSGGLLPACADDAASFALSDRTDVEVTADGAAVIEVEGRTVGRLAPHGLRGARFTPGHNEFIGMYEHFREGETRFDFAFDDATATADDMVTLRYRDDDGAEARLSIRDDGSRVSLRVESDLSLQSLAVPVACESEGTFHGFGEQFNATDQRGEAFDLFVSEQGIGRTGVPNSVAPGGDAHTTYYPMPYFVDARGYGWLLETDHRTIVDLCASDPETAWFEVEGGARFDVTVFAGPTVPDVVRQLGDAVGRPQPPPPWAYRLWIGAQGGRDAVLAEVDALEAAEIPVGVIWAQDWSGQRPNLGGGSGVEYRWVADETLYPDLAGLVDDLHRRDLRFLTYANPFIDAALDDHFPAMDADGLLVRDAGGASLISASPAGDTGHPDFTRSETRDYTTAFLRAKVEDFGIDGWMADFGEYLPLDAVLSDGRDPRAYHNRYPEAWHRNGREVFDALRPDGDYVLFTRSGWTGQQAVANVVWCGDQEATFAAGDGIGTVVPCMINLGLAGVPFVTHDIAGFSGGPSTKELYLRWIELGAFSPIMRTHEGNLKEENWSWERDAETTDHLRRFARVHDALAPELQTWAAAFPTTGLPLVRHMMIVFPEDPNCRPLSDQYMLGPALLVAPVLTEGSTSRSVYLPPGTWYDVWTGNAREGGQRVDVDAPLGRPPVFHLGSDRPDLRAITP
ncbi:MAG: TIM-barrel domain-containing protein [Myxococcota bacterium]